MEKLFFLLCLSILVLQSCSNDDDENDPIPIENSVKLANNNTHGKILTDSKGMSLYFISKENKQNSEYLSERLVAQPIFYEENLTLDAGLDMTDFTTIIRTDGAKHMFYKELTLYYFAQDTQAGETKGDHANNVSFIARPYYSLMYVSSQLVDHDKTNHKSVYSEGDESTFHITNIEGNTLNAFKKETENTNNFSKEDFLNDSFLIIAEINFNRIPSILDVNDFNTIDVFGKTQLTSKGWPLYYFGQDGSLGYNKSISFPEPEILPLVNADIIDVPIL